MKASLVILGTVPLLCAVIGFGLGLTLKPDAANASIKRADTAESASHAPAETENQEHLPPEDGGHDEAADSPQTPAATHDVESAPADGAHPADVHETENNQSLNDAHVVRVGQIKVPVYKASSITYVVANFGVTVTNTEAAVHYQVAENSIRLRDAILSSMLRAAETPILSGVAINSDELASVITSDLKPEFGDVTGVLFLSLVKMDVARS